MSFKILLYQKHCMFWNLQQILHCMNIEINDEFTRNYSFFCIYTEIRQFCAKKLYD